MDKELEEMVKDLGRQDMQIAVLMWIKTHQDSLGAYLTDSLIAAMAAARPK